MGILCCTWEFAFSIEICRKKKSSDIAGEASDFNMWERRLQACNACPLVGRHTETARTMARTPKRTTGATPAKKRTQTPQATGKKNGAVGSATAPPQPPMEHPRIHIDTIEDLLFVKQQLQRAAETLVSGRVVEEAQTSNKRSKKSERKDDPEREAMEARLQAKMKGFVDTVVELAYPGIDVNGMDPTEALTSHQKFEPLDEQLKVLLQSKINQRDDLLVKVCTLRKQIPGQIAQIVSKDQHARSLHSVQVKLPEEESKSRKRLREGDDDEQANGNEDEEDAENQDDETTSNKVDFDLLADTYKKAIMVPATLRTKLPILNGKLERAKLSYTMP